MPIHIKGFKRRRLESEHSSWNVIPSEDFPADLHISPNLAANCKIAASKSKRTYMIQVQNIDDDNNICRIQNHMKELYYQLHCSILVG